MEKPPCRPLRNTGGLDGLWRGKKIIFIKTNSEIDGFDSFLLLHTCTCDNYSLINAEPVLIPCNDKTKSMYAAVHRPSTLT